MVHLGEVPLPRGVDTDPGAVERAQEVGCGVRVERGRTELRTDPPGELLHDAGPRARQRARAEQRVSSRSCSAASNGRPTWVSSAPASAPADSAASRSRSRAAWAERRTASCCARCSSTTSARRQGVDRVDEVEQRRLDVRGGLARLPPRVAGRGQRAGRVRRPGQHGVALAQVLAAGHGDPRGQQRRVAAARVGPDPAGLVRLQPGDVRGQRGPGQPLRRGRSAVPVEHGHVDAVLGGSDGDIHPATVVRRRARPGCAGPGRLSAVTEAARAPRAPSAADPAVGLTSDEAEARRRRGEANRAVSASSRTYGRILRTNVFNLYNTILFVIGAALLALGRYGDAVISVSIGLLNAAVSAVQEIRAKRQLDRLQLLARGTVVVVRDGRDVEVAPEEVVRGDVVRVRPGDQLVVDGPVLEGAVEVDESLLTGESEAQVRYARGGPALGQPQRRRRRAASSPATWGRRATRTGSPPRRGGPRPTRPRCSARSRSASAWSWSSWS